MQQFEFHPLFLLGAQITFPEVSDEDVVLVHLLSIGFFF